MNNKNHEGYYDPTAYYGMKDVVKEEAEADAAIHKLIYHIRYIAGLAGFDVSSRIVFTDKKTGKVFK